jgi:hypothetical protein
MSTGISVSSGGGFRLGHSGSERAIALSGLIVLALTPVAQAGNTSSNSSSNSSKGIHTRVDTIIADEGSMNGAQFVSACLTAIAPSASGSRPRMG